MNSAQEPLAQLLALRSPGDKVCRTPLPVASTISAHLRATEKGEKAIESAVLSTYQKPQSLGFNGEFHVWEHLLRIHD